MLLPATTVPIITTRGKEMIQETQRVMKIQLISIQKMLRPQKIQTELEERIQPKNKLEIKIRPDISQKKKIIKM